MTQPQALLLETHLKKLRLPNILRQYRKLATQAAEGNLTHEQFLHLLIEQEVQLREQNALKQRIRYAHFPSEKTLSDFDFTAIPQLNKPLILRLAQGEYLNKAQNIVLLGNSKKLLRYSTKREAFVRLCSKAIPIRTASLFKLF